MATIMTDTIIGRHATPSVRQHLAAMWQLFDYLTTWGFLDHNPADSVRGPKYLGSAARRPSDRALRPGSYSIQFEVTL